MVAGEFADAQAGQEKEVEIGNGGRDCWLSSFTLVLVGVGEFRPRPSLLGVCPRLLRWLPARTGQRSGREEMESDR